MAEPSPAAQAVLDAAYSELDPYSELDAYVTQRQVGWCAAAALRAAAYTIDWESGDPKFLLENVAAELESQ